MTRTVSSGFATAIGGEHVLGALLIELYFASGTAYLTNCPHALVWNGNTYLGAAGIATSDIRETSTSEVVGVQFAIAGTLAPFIAMALDEAAHSRGRPAIVRLAIFDANSQIVADPVIEWQGFIDTLQISDAATGQTQIAVNCENRFAQFARPRIRRHTLADHQRDYPGDMFYQYVAQLVDKTIVWPSREWYRIKGQQ